MSVEGIPQRDVVVTFSKHFASYNAGESAAFTADEAARLAEQGVTGEAPPPTAPPAVVAVPYVEQVGATLTCTMGEWSGEPTAYAYQWQLDGANVGADSATVDVTPAAVGLTATCVVTATNANGSTTAPPSNGVVVT
jgi:hypothetical protein